MKKLFKVLILTFLCQQAFTQSKMDMQANNITINRPLFIEHNSTVAMQFKSPTNFSTQFLFYNGNVNSGGITRAGKGLQFTFVNGIIFDVGDPFDVSNPQQRTTIVSSGLITDGFLKSGDLSFTTTNNAQLRPVFANKDGVLKVDNSATLYQSYNFTAVQTQNWDDQLQKGSGFAWFNTTNASKTMYLPVNLPDGVEITLVSMTYVDNSASSIDFIMYANNNNNNAFTTISSGTSILASSGIRTSATVANAIVDNNVNSYYVNITSGGNWTGGTLQFHSLVISYRYR